MDHDLEVKVSDAEAQLEGVRSMRKACAAALPLCKSDDEKGLVLEALTIAQREEGDRAIAIEAIRSGLSPLEAARTAAVEATNSYNLSSHCQYYGATTREEAERLFVDMGAKQLLAAGAARAYESAQQQAGSAVSTATNGRIRLLWDDAGRIARSIRGIFETGGTVGDVMQAGISNRGDRAPFIIVRLLGDVAAELAPADRADFRALIGNVADSLVAREEVKVKQRHARAGMAMTEETAQSYRAQYAREAQEDADKRARPARGGTP